MFIIGKTAMYTGSGVEKTGGDANGRAVASPAGA